MGAPDLSEFVQLSRPKRKPCSVGVALANLDPADGTNLLAALAADPGIITNAAIEAWLKRREQESTITAIVNHRAGRCRCDA